MNNQNIGDKYDHVLIPLQIQRKFERIRVLRSKTRTTANEEEEVKEETVERRETGTTGRGKQEEEEEGQSNSNLVTPLPTKRTQEASSAPFTTVYSHLIPADPSYLSAPPSTSNYSRNSETG